MIILKSKLQLLSPQKRLKCQLFQIVTMTVIELSTDDILPVSLGINVGVQIEGGLGRNRAQVCAALSINKGGAKVCRLRSLASPKFKHQNERSVNPHLFNC